jgi:hypothetical protein
VVQNLLAPGCVQVRRRGAEKGAGRSLVEWFDVQDLPAGGQERGGIASAYPAHDDDGVIVDSSRQERHRVLAGLIKPLQVIDDHGDRLTARDTRQHVESRQAYQEGLRRTIFLDSERRQQCPALRGRQGVRCSQDGAYQLMESGERQLGFGFDAGRSQDKMPALLPATGRRFDQYRFADARLAAYCEGVTGLGRSVDGRGQDLSSCSRPMICSAGSIIAGTTL